MIVVVIEIIVLKMKPNSVKIELILFSLNQTITMYIIIK